MNTGLFIILLAITLGTYDIISKLIKLWEWHIKYDTKTITERRSEKWDSL